MDWGRFAQQMASMARDLLAQDSLAATLERITASATELVDGCDAAGILVLHDKRVETLAPTHPMVTDSERLQERLGKAPASTPPTARTANGSSASPTSPANSSAGPRTPHRHTSSGWAA